MLFGLLVFSQNSSTGNGISVTNGNGTAYSNGKAIFQNPNPIYVGDTGVIKVIAAVPLNFNYTITWTFNDQYIFADSTTLALDIVDPTIGDQKPILIDNNIPGTQKSYVWFVDPTIFKGDVNGYQLRLYDSTCVPPKCIVTGIGKLILSQSQAFIIYNPPNPVQDNPLINTASPYPTIIWSLLALYAL